MIRTRLLTCVAIIAASVVHCTGPCNAQSEWISPTGGDWIDPLNWSPSVPNGSGDIALFGALTGPFLEVSLELAPVTVGEIQFLGPGVVNIFGEQALTLDAGFSGPLPRIFVAGTAAIPLLQVPLAGNTGWEKAGEGTLALYGPQNVLGPTVISEGTLSLGPGSPLQNGPVIVRGGANWDVSSFPSYSLASGQGLTGGGTITANELRVPNDSFISPGDGVGALTIDGSLRLDAPVPIAEGGLGFELSADPLSGANDVINVTGNVDVFGFHQIFVTPIDNQLTPGVYPLVNYEGTLNISGGTLVPVHSTRYTMTIDTSTPGQIGLGMGGSNASLIWTGNVDNNWDIGTTPNWTGGGILYFDLDDVLFDDTATRFDVNIVQDVRPGSVTFNNSLNDYQIFGPGAIRGNAPFVKQGTGKVTLFTRAEFSTANIQSGTVEVGLNGELAASNSVAVGNSGHLQLNGGFVETPQLTVAGGGQLTGNGSITGNVTIGDGGGVPAVLSPGFSPGTIQIDGDLDLESNAETVIEISGSPGNPHDMIAVTGDALLDGKLQIDAIDGYAPLPGDTFTVLTSADLDSTTFADVEAARVGDVILWPTYQTSSLLIIGQRVGDMDLSGVVDEDDIPLFAFALRDNEGYDDALFFTEHEVADVDGNGRVDFGDMSPFASKVSMSSPLSTEEILAVIQASLAVPEPTTFGMIVLGIIGLLAQGCRPARHSTRRCGFTLIELLVVITIISLLVGLLLPAIQATREAARQSTCLGHCSQLALALHNYEAQHRAFPTGAHAHRQASVMSIGWQVLVLPYLEQRELYDRIDPDADGGAGVNGHNMSVYPVPQFHCPSDEPPFNDLENLNGSNYVGVAGANSAEGVIDLEDKQCGDLFINGVLTYKRATTIADVTDGTSHTLALGERTYGLEVWSAGADWRGDPPNKICAASIKNLRYPLNSNLERIGYYVRDPEAPADKRLMTRNDLLFGSRHPGGAHFAFADGSARFLDDGMDFTILQDLATRNGGETRR